MFSSKQMVLGKNFIDNSVKKFHEVDKQKKEILNGTQQKL